MKKDLKTVYGVIAAVALILPLFVIVAAKAAESSSDAVRLEVTTICNREATMIKVRNAGVSWPKTSHFAIYDLAGGSSELLSKRRLRLKQGQHASFRIKHKSGNARVGLWVEPSWYTRAFLYDAVVNCAGK